MFSKQAENLALSASTENQLRLSDEKGFLSSFPVNTSANLVSVEQLERVVEKQALLRDLESSGLSKSEFVRQRGICRATLYRDMARRRNGGFTGFIDKRKQREKKGIVMDDRFTQIILSFLVDRPKAPITAIHSELVKASVDGGLGEPPAYSKVRRFCRRIAPDVLLQFSQGRKERVENGALTIRRTVTEVNRLWQTDFSEIPLWTFDPTFGPELFKPWLIGAIDCASRVIPGASVCKTVNAAEILKCWKKAMLPKGLPSYPFYGVPSTLSMDNHQVYKGDAQQSLVMLGVEPLFIRNNSPEQQGKQERWFQTFQSRLISKLFGFADQYRGKEKAAKQTIPYPLLQKLVDDFLLEYHLAEHSSLSTTPWEGWHHMLPAANGLLTPGSEIDRCLRVSREVTVSPEGVQVDKQHFTAAFLEGRVGDKLTARAQPEGAVDFVSIFDHGLYLGDAKQHIDSDLALQISKSRLERTMAIESLAQSIREKTPQAPVFPTPPVPAPPAEEPLSVPDLSPQENGPAGLSGKLGSIPDLVPKGNSTHE